MSGSVSVFMRELKLAWSGGGGPVLPVGFFGVACIMTPFAVGPEIENLKTAGPGVMWIAMALASLLPMERLFQADLEDGTLDAYAGSGVAMEGIAIAKTLAHWIATGVPLSLVAPILWIMLQGAPELAPLVVLTSPYRSLLTPFLDYVNHLLAVGENHVVTIVIPEFVPARWWQHLLHNQTALLVKGALLFRRGVVVVDVPFHLHS